MSQFSFPVLENEELLPCLEEMEIPITAAQLAKPTYEVVAPIFENILVNLTGITREELNQPVFAAIDAFEYPELHDESIAARSFFSQLAKLMGVCGVKDFGMKDVHKPDPQRLRRHLSAIINFAKFREEKLVAYAELQARLESLVEQKRALREEKAAREEELAQLQQERAGEVADASQVQAEADELRGINQQLNKQFAAASSEVKTLKTQVSQLSESVQAEKFELMAAGQENERLREQVVQSPEKFKRSLNELQGAVDDERGHVDAADKRCRVLQARHDVVAKVEKDVQKCLELMKEIENEVARKKDASRRAKELREQIGSSSNDASDLEAQQQHLLRQQATLKDRIRKLESQAALKKEALASKIEEHLKDREAVEAENACQAALAAQHEATVRGTQERARELAAVHSAAVGALLDKYSALRGEVDAYNAALSLAIRGDGSAAGAGASRSSGVGLLSAVKGAAAAQSRPSAGRASTGFPADIGKLRDQLTDLTV
ncbi:MAG: Nuf2 family-domain-containing protein [Monoraphidium minutum]|nr:MAG: Nuf2 family-domain-containing protein [Monoraphidium minutum]